MTVAPPWIASPGGIGFMVAALPEPVLVLLVTIGHAVAPTTRCPSTSRPTFGGDAGFSVAPRAVIDFLGYTFQPRRAKSRWGKYFVSFLPAMSNKTANKVRATIRSWLAATRNNQSLEDLAGVIDPRVDELLRPVLRVSSRLRAQIPKPCPGEMGMPESQTVQAPRAASSPLVGSHRSKDPRCIGPMETRHHTGGWTIGAG